MFHRVSFVSKAAIIPGKDEKVCALSTQQELAYVAF
jgi:hypothetical protein